MTSRDDYTALVLGATGNVGVHVIERLKELAPAGFRIRAASRDPSCERATRLLTSAGGSEKLTAHLDLVKVDYEDEATLVEACEGATHVFFALPQASSPDDMLRHQERLASVLHRRRPSVVVKLSSYGIDERSSGPFVQTQGPLGEAHREGEDLFRRHSIPTISLRPTSFFTNFTQYDLPRLHTERIVSSPLGVGPRVNWISCEDIAAVAAHCLVGKVDVPNGFKVLDVTGPEDSTLSAGDVCSIASSALGTSVEYVETPLPEDAAYGGLWKFLRAGGFDVCTNTVAEVTGRPPASFPEFLHRQLGTKV